jgi:hypothetical protein
MALTDHARAFFVKIGIVQGGTHGNMVPAECRAICHALVPTAVGGGGAAGGRAGPAAA